MSEQKRSIFDGIKDVKVGKNFEYLRGGHYWLAIRQCKVGEDRKFNKFFAVEFTVVRVLDDNNGAGHVAGDEVSWMVKRTSDYFLREVKGFIAAVTGLPSDEIDAPECEEVCAMDGDNPQPLKYAIVEVRGNDNPVERENGQVTLYWRGRFIKEIPLMEAIEKIEDEAALLKAMDGEDNLQELLKLEQEA
jgi:hypothetical protein